MSKENILKISKQAFADETACVRMLSDYISDLRKYSEQINNKAQSYIEYVRRSAKHSLTELFLQEYNLNSKEGRALMCIAESLLRIPDNETADALIRDNLADAKWEKMGKVESPLVNISARGLKAASFIAGLKNIDVEQDGNFLGAILGGLAVEASEPFVRSMVRHTMRVAGGQFVLEQTIERALSRSNKYKEKGYLFSYDMLGEGARSTAQAEIYTRNYIHAIEVIGKKSANIPDIFSKPGISVKISALHPRYELIKIDRLKKELLPRLKEVIIGAMRNNIAVTIDAEEARRLDLSLLLYSELSMDPVLANYNGLGLAVQSYQKRAFAVIDYLKELARETGRKIPVRLVKGAYWDSEIKRYQLDGTENFPVFSKKYHTDASYLACAKKLFDNHEYFYPQFGTHNALTIASIITMSKKRDFEFQRLHGMGETLYDYILKKEGVKCRVYAPVGSYEELLPYLTRRILENGANTSFVNMLSDKTIPVSALLKNPLISAANENFHANAAIRLPADIYVGRKNSSGIDCGNLYQLENLSEELQKYSEELWYVQPIISGKKMSGDAVDIYQPSNKAVKLGRKIEAEEDDCKLAFSEAKSAFAEWTRKSAEERASILEKIADLYEQHRVELVSLCIREGGKTLQDAIAEVREAIDFCRYYAQEAIKLQSANISLRGATGESNELVLKGRGVFVAISPWNFPLAIFTGQIVAALVTGNCVLAKPAEQTPLIAGLAVGLMLEAGIPDDVLHLLPGRGEMIGQYLVSNPEIAGVTFTGSTATARIINKTLAGRDGPIVPFIAETGGQNCMIVDSSALVEQTVDDIIVSAFGSAGQRCSALRVCYIQDDIADRLIEVLVRAMQEISVGDPFDISTDIGPVIGQESQLNLLKHISRMRMEAKYIASTPVSGEVAKEGYYVAPHVFEIKSVRQLDGEVFGPVLHITRFRLKNIDKAIDEINSTGYGLTFGIQSRINERINYISRRINAGNIYVNRSMIGAVVGVQPFGGEGLSGTGPKAGGPHYLLRFCTERSFSNNIAAIGGNLELLG